MCSLEHIIVCLKPAVLLIIILERNNMCNSHPIFRQLYFRRDFGFECLLLIRLIRVNGSIKHGRSKTVSIFLLSNENVYTYY